MHFFTPLAISTLLTLQTVYAHPLLGKREQPGVPETPKLELKPLKWGDVNFIHTTDTHGWLEVRLKPFFSRRNIAHLLIYTGTSSRAIIQC